MTKDDKPQKPLKPGQKLSAEGRPIPLSERERKYQNWSKEQCVEHLRDMQKKHPDQHITRNFFRANSQISEATWNRHFGTFEQFKRSAGLELSRHARRLERNIARHAGMDLISAFNEQKAEWSGRYVRPSSGSRWKTLLAVSDIHDRFCDPFWKRVVTDTAKRCQPEIICINGDLFDLPEFSRWTQDPREWDAVGRIKEALAFIGALREACPDAQIDLIEGNHEFRLFRHLAEATPALKAVLADLHGFDIPKLLGIEKYEVNFTGNADLKAWTERDIKTEVNRNFKVYWDCLLACHYPDRRKLHIPGFGGHHHKHEVWPFQSASYGAVEFHQMGCGHYRAASYADGELWHMGFMICHVDTSRKQTCFDYVPVQDHAVSGGQWYTRTPDEEIV